VPGRLSMRRLALTATVLGLLLAGAALTAAGVVTPDWYDRFFLPFTALVLLNLMRLAGLPSAAAWCASGGLVAAGLIGLELFPALRYAPYLMIAVINLGVSLIFARGLLPGHEPVLIQLIRHMNFGPDMPPVFRVFVRGQCQIWAIVGLATGLVGLFAVFVPATRDFADPALVVLLGGQVVLFVGSHWYATWRYGRPETWFTTVAALSRPSTWAALRL